MHQFPTPVLMPTPPQPTPEIGGWVQDRVLGSGGFGTVTLWRHKESSETVALKKTRQELNPKNRERWKLEVDIMKRLKHDHVVTAMDVPDPLKPSIDHLPFLAMEFCSGGDLRKVLSRPENYCGMKEIDVRNVVRHVASGVEYLHSKRIIHRDLKPENIVLQEEEGGEVVYKLIDLGYAKDLDQGSVCSSFVGTLQYLAPELFASQRYTRTVDYWSFGTLVFECITGSRPFLPNRNPVQWHLEVKRRKQDTHIRAYEERTGEIKLASDIPAPHHLCQPLVERFESWLQLMLRWEPQGRGGGGNNRATCFELLDSILDLKIVHVLDMHTGQLYSYPVEEDETVESLMIRLALETQMPVEHQELMFSTGMSPDPNGKVSQCWEEPGKDDNFVFLFNKNFIDESKFVFKPLPEVVKVMSEIKLASDIPAPHHLCQPLVERFESWLQLMLRWEPQGRGGGGNNRATCFELLDSILDLKIVHVLDMHTGQLYSYPVEEDETVESLMIRLALETQMPVEHQELMFSTGMSPDPNGKVSQCWEEPERKKSYGLSYHYCRQTADNYNQLFKGSRASMLNLLRLQNTMTKLVKEISSSFCTYKGQAAHFMASLECDMEKYAEQSTTGITSEKMFRSWRETQKEVEAVTTVHQDEVLKHESASTALQTKLVQPQRSPLARRRQIEELDDMKLIELRKEVKELLPKIQRTLKDIEESRKKLTAFQRKRQQDLWTLLKVVSLDWSFLQDAMEVRHDRDSTKESVEESL
uniref:IkappaB kinase n=1 Tax=Branchiostoma floridae TaxID=7739 RepID=C3YFT5_BRAFL|eukprot:XP_002604730.1 hypothetical protein BRAFLDRAFT_80298 [Branchiostoma floridae]